MGLSIAQGTLVTSPNMASPFKSTLFFDKNNNATLSNTIPDQLDDIYIAITGSQILKKGKPVLNINSLKPESRYRHPRTAVGLSKDKHYLYVFVIDGRQPGYSEGATLLELAKWTRHFGAYQAINLDGGGSSTLVIDKGKNTPYLLNRVSGKQLRSNGSHLGISAPALKPN